MAEIPKSYVGHMYYISLKTLNQKSEQEVSKFWSLK